MDWVAISLVFCRTSAAVPAIVQSGHLAAEHGRGRAGGGMFAV
jgi:hypothetical protein